MILLAVAFQTNGLPSAAHPPRYTSGYTHGSQSGSCGALAPAVTRLLFTESGVGARTEGAYLRKTDDSPAVRIGNGYAFGLSPDGRWALSIVSAPPAQLFLLPTGAGEPRVLPRGKIFVYGGFQATWFARPCQYTFCYPCGCSFPSVLSRRLKPTLKGAPFL
jgi:hypothetical protein